MMQRTMIMLWRWRYLLTALLCSAWGMYLRFDRFAGRELWVDERLTQSVAAGAFQPFWQRLTYGEITSFPGPYLLSWPLAQLFSPDKWVLAIPHILASMAMFFALYLICRRYLTSLIAWAIVFVLAAKNASLVFHGFELRPYAVLAALGPAIFYAADTVINQAKTLPFRSKAGIAALFIFACGYHAYGIVILAFCSAYILLFGRTSGQTLKQAFGQALPFYVKTGLIMAPLFFWYFSGSAIYAAPHSSDVSTVFMYIRNPLIDPIGFLRDVFGNLVGFHEMNPLVGLVPLAILLSASKRLVLAGFFIILVVWPIQLLLLSDIQRNYYFLQRQFIWIMPLFAFYLGWCWQALEEELRKKWTKR